MAVGNAQPYNSSQATLLKNNWESAGFYAVLLDNAYTPSDAHDTYSDVSANECTDTDYDQKDLTSEAITTTGADTYIDSADVSFGANVTISARYFAVLQGDAATPAATDELVFYVDLSTGGGNVSSTNATFSVLAPTNGWIKVTHS
ncbi:MAG: hypothetical protein L0H83_03450 [Salinisphaera sp.]|nr:hypothetical protein [Salinisphaera sp.]